MEINFVESNPIPVKAAMAEMGLLEAVLAPATGGAEGGKSARGCASARFVWGSPRECMLPSQIERLFDEPPAQYREEHFRLFRRIQGRAESRRGSRCRA